jgi:hypothetical protein
MRNIRILVLLVVLSIALYSARYAFIWASTPVDGTTSFDYFMSGVFAVFGVFTLAVFAVMLAYSILEKPTQETSTIDTADIAPSIKTVDTTTDSYTVRRQSEIDAYRIRRQSEIDAYTARRTAEIQAYHARKTAEIQAYRAFRTGGE